MGYRDRQAHRSQKRNEQFGNAQSGTTRRASLPAPDTMDTNRTKLNLPPNHAVLLQDCAPTDSGLKIYERPQIEATLASTSGTEPYGFVAYYGSGSASAEFWVAAGNAIHRLTDAVATQGDQTASVEVSGVIRDYSYEEFNKTIIMVNGANDARKWNRASAWETWVASFSGTSSAGDMWGITKFKNRLFCWEKNDTKIWYGSVDQVEGTFNPFELGGQITGNLLITTTLSKDGGAGPDDYIIFISDQGDAAVYEGTDPADANNWSLVGTFKIGRPLSKHSFAQYGAQTVVLCQDDFYFLPGDLAGKRNATLAAEYREADINLGKINSVYYERDGLIIFSEGSVLSTKRGMAYSNIAMTSVEPFALRSDATAFYGTGTTAARPILGEFRGRVFSVVDPPSTATDQLLRVRDLFPPQVGGTRTVNAKIRTSPIQTQGRTNITLVNPKFGLQPYWSASTSSEMHLVYRTAVIYDEYHRPYHSADPALFVTATASTNSEGLWTPGFGTGDTAQIVIEVISASAADGDIILYGIDLIAEDTGGI